MFAPPAVAGDIVFVASCSGSAYGLDRATGEVVWTYDTGADGRRAEFHGMPVVTSELIVTATDDRREAGVGHVYALERRTGTVRWKRPVAIGVMSDLIRFDDALYYATLTERVESLRIDNGELVWKLDTEVSNTEFYRTSSPLVTRDRVVFGGVDGTVRAVDRMSGKESWSRDLGSRVTTSLVLMGAALYVGTTDNKLHLLRLDDGQVSASRDLGSLPVGRPVALEDRLIVAAMGGKLLALTPGLEELRWESRIDSEWASFRPVVKDGIVLDGADDGNLYALRLSDGAPAWSRDFGAPVTSVTVTEDGAYVGTSKGVVFSCLWVDNRK